MSLNGLDDVKVKEAHETAVAELGGWFLLKYVSRDEVDLLGRGNGGIVEIRNAIAQYEEESPLFGYLRYRRRNVLIKYVPEGCSRLVQARVTVHFNAVTEKFSPHDTTFPITTAKELRDSTLSAACSLHTASGSTSSSTSSLRRRRLMEIAEDENEDKRQSTVVEERAATDKEPSIADSQSHQNSAKHLESSTSFASKASDSASLSPPVGSDMRPRSPTKSLDGRRKSSQSTRPDLYSYSSFGSNGRPKVKLGPRPSLDISGRPQTSQSSASYRPVSTLPPGLKLVPKTSTRQKDRAQSQIPPTNPPPTMTFSPPPLAGPSSAVKTTTLIRPHTSGGRPSTSSGSSIKPPLSPSIVAPKSPTLTPEKLRLMKALELRKKKMAVSSQPEPLLSPSHETLEAPTVPEIRLSQSSLKDVADALATLSDMARADSGVEIEGASEDAVAASDATRTSSMPGSPTEPSEEAESTKASSVSDSTDETVQETPNTLDAKSTMDKSVEDPLHTTPVESKTQESRIDPHILSTEVAEIQSVDTGIPEVESQGQEEAKDHFTGGDEERVEKVPVEPSAADDPLSEQERDQASNATESAPIRNDDEGVTAAEKEEVINTSNSNRPELGASEISTKVPSTPEPNKDTHSSVISQSVEIAPTQTPTREWKIPRSKFSSQNLEPKEDVKSSDVPSSVSEDKSPGPPKSPVGSTFSNDTKRSLTEEEQDAGTAGQAKKKRKGLIEPIRTDISADRSGHNSDAEFLSDDDLMDELQSATVQEAKPISVGKSPVSPVFSGQMKKSSAESNRFSRAFSNPLRKDSSKGKDFSAQSPLPEPSRSVSANFINQGNQQPALPIAKKVNLGSGISQRIKALEKLSSSAANITPPPGTAGPISGSSPAFFAVAKSNSRAGSKSPSILERGESFARNKTPPAVSRESSPEALKFRGRSGSIQSRREAFSSVPVTPLQRSRPESISVTARIIRDPSQQFPQKPEIGKDALDFSPLDLQQSPLVIDHQRAIVAPPSPRKETIQERRLSNPQKEAKKERRSSITIVKDLINDRRSSFAERRKSMSIEAPTASPARSPSRPPSTHANSSSSTRPMSVSSRRSSTSRDMSASLSPGAPQGQFSPAIPDENAEKKSGRTSRMLRLMSASISASRKSLAHAISPTVREELEPPHLLNQTISSPQPSLTAVTIEIGDVNVQFPDNLLWKRRSMSLDSQGFLILSQAQSNKGMDKNTGIKRYHLSEFRTPFVPEMEAQELPNSVVLDFIDGGGLQVACEDRGGQIRILQLLLEAHRSYIAFGQ